jgi:pimeloyl-ACP methyl ester carboxylesterase
MSIKPKRYLILVVLLGLLAAGRAHAAEVTLKYRGLTLDAELDYAAGKTLADGVILITHGAQAHNNMETLAYLRSLLKDKGYNTLAINLSLGIDKRHGFYDCARPSTHTNDDAVAEIGAWVEWLGGQGAKKIVLLGHSRGGAQTALFAAEHDDPRVRAVILMAPAASDQAEDAQAYQARAGKPLAPELARAQALVKAGKGGTLLEHVPLMALCRDTSVTAASFVSYYGPDPRRNTITLLPKMKKPTLIFVAGDDQIVKGLDKKAAPFVDGKRVRLKVIPGSDHFFRDLWMDDAVDAMVDFLGPDMKAVD